MSEQHLPLFQVLIEEYNRQQEDRPAPRLKYALNTTELQKYRAAADKRNDRECDRINSAEVKAFYQWLHMIDAAGTKRSALCFSGGGIRSATFGLGVLQGLARIGLLDKFDFLSTVSGGGYLGSWLSAWIHRKGIRTVQERLKNESPASPLHPEPDPIVHLRSYSNYLSPRLGLLSADTWTLAGIFLRNLILNWLILIPLLLLVLLVPRFCVAAVAQKPGLVSAPEWLRMLLVWLSADGSSGALLIGILGGFLSVAYIYANRPSLADHNLGDGTYFGSTLPDKLKTQGWFLALCLFPLLLLAILATSYYAWLGAPLADLTFPRLGFAQRPLFAFIGFGIALNVGGLVIFSILFKRPLAILRTAAIEVPIALLTGGLGGFLIWLAADKIFPFPLDPNASIPVYVCFAAPGFLVAFLLAGTVFVGASSRVTSDADREWIARAGAWIMIAAVVWIVISVIVIFGPVLLQYGIKTALSVGSLSGLVTLVLGHGGKTSAKPKQASTTPDILLTVAAPIFAAFILICLSLATSWLIVELETTVAFDFGELGNYEGLIDIVQRTPLGFILWMFAIFLGIGAAASWAVNINKFSLNAAYRNRLIRAYLGASRVEEERKPNPFTGLDEHDNLQMEQLRTQLFNDGNVPGLEIMVNRLTVTAPPPAVAGFFQRVLRRQPAKGGDPVSQYVWGRLSAKSKDLILKSPKPVVMTDELKYSLYDDLNRILLGDSIYESERFAAITLTPEIQNLLDQKPLVETVLLNRLLLSAAYPRAFDRPPMCKPLHVINITLNLVRGKNLAWQERKAESFTVSALHSGSFRLGYRDSRLYALGKNNEAITLGTAAAISGAAVSPNMGYYSSTFVTFLLALFNLRLGWWLGNPGKAGEKTFNKAGPAIAARPIIDETLGLTDDEHPYVYLSDGGHFENLGLYEMVLRRCKYILVSDGSADEAFVFEGLGNAISKVRVDLGIPIEIKEIFMLPRDKKEDERHYGETNRQFQNKYCAVGSIRYSCVDGGNSSDPPEKYDGTLIYIKAFLSGTEPVDVYAYAKAHGSFPHQSTADQWFTESQFESYRELGSHIMDQIVEGIPNGMPLVSVENFFSSVARPPKVPPSITPRE